MLDAARWLDAAAERADGRLEAPAAALQRALIELGEAHAGVESALEAMDFDPRDLKPPKSGCSPCARWPASMTCWPMTWPVLPRPCAPA